MDRRQLFGFLFFLFASAFGRGHLFFSDFLHLFWVYWAFFHQRGLQLLTGKVLSTTNCSSNSSFSLFSHISWLFFSYLNFILAALFNLDKLLCKFRLFFPLFIKFSEPFLLSLENYFGIILQLPNKAITWVYARPLLLRFLLCLIIRKQMLAYKISNHKRTAAWDASVAMNQNSTLCSSFLNDFKNFFKQFNAYFLLLVVVNVICIVIDFGGYFIFGWLSLNADRNYRHYAIGFNNAHIKCWVAVSED